MNASRLPSGLNDKLFIHVEGVNLRRFAAAGTDRVKLALSPVVIRFVDAQGGENICELSFDQTTLPSSKRPDVSCWRHLIVGTAQP